MATGEKQTADRGRAQDVRSRKVTWTRPLAVLPRLAGLSRAEMLEAFVAGELPRAPVAELVGFDLEEVADGRAVMVFEAGEHLCNPMGIIAGGMTATVMDAAMWVAVHSILGEDVYASTTSLTVNFTRPLPANGARLTAEALAVHCGHSAASAEAAIRDDSGTVYAHGSTTLACVQAA